MVIKLTLLREHQFLGATKVMDKLILIFIFTLLASSWVVQAESSFSVETEKGPYLLYKSSRALVIGAAKYKFWSPLDSVPEDVINVKNSLEKQGFYVRTILNPDGKKLRQSIEDFLSNNEGTSEEIRERRLVIYFAGHGTTDNKYIGYLVPVDAPADPADTKFNKTALGMDVIKTWAGRSEAKHILFVFDSCYSGSVFLKRGNIRPPNELFIRDVDQPAKYFITAGSKDEEVPAISDFTPAFIRGLEGGADLDKDGLVTAVELGWWLKTEITNKGKQTPQFGTVEDIFSPGQVIFGYSTASPKKLALYSNNQPIAHMDPAATTIATRGKTIQLIGEPSDSRGNAFRGIQLYYYQKIGDGERIIDSLEKGGIPYFTTRAQLPKFKTNTIACGPDTPIEAVQTLAKTLIDDGIILQAIIQFREPEKKVGRIELLAMSEDAKGVKEMTSAPLTIEQIQKLKYCPGRLINK